MKSIEDSANEVNVILKTNGSPSLTALRAATPRNLPTVKDAIHRLRVLFFRGAVNNWRSMKMSVYAAVAISVVMSVILVALIQAPSVKGASDATPARPNLVIPSDAAGLQF